MKLSKFKHLLVLGFISFLLYHAVKLQIWKEFNQAIIYSILLCQPFSILINILGGYRYGILVRTEDSSFPLKLGVKTITIINTLSIFIPGRIAEFAKVTYSQEKGHVKAGTVLATITLEKILDLSALFIAIVLLLLYHVSTRGVFIFGILAIGGILFLLFLPFFFPFLKKYSSQFIPSGMVRNFFKDILVHLHTKSRHKGFMSGALLTALIWICAYCAIYFYIYFATGISLSPIQTLMLFVFTVVGGAIAILPASLGTFEIAAIYVLSTFHYPLHVAATIGIGLHMALIGIVPIYGMWIMLREGIGIRQFLAQIQAALRSSKKDQI